MVVREFDETGDVAEFKALYAADPDTAIKILFAALDLTGRKDVFYKGFEHVVATDPATAKWNLSHIVGVRNSRTFPPQKPNESIDMYVCESHRDPFIQAPGEQFVLPVIGSWSVLRDMYDLFPRFRPEIITLFANQVRKDVRDKVWSEALSCVPKGALERAGVAVDRTYSDPPKTPLVHHRDRYVVVRSFR